MNRILIFVLLCALIFGIYSFNNVSTSSTSPVTSEVNTFSNEVKWYTWEEAVAANEKNPKKIFVDVYTDWCGWCKVMDKKTFTEEKVAKYMNEHFYAIKLNAEQKEDINFRGKIFSWKEGGRNGIHALAYSILSGKLSYPTVVYLDDKFDIISTSPGYKTPEDIMPELTYAADELYRKTKWDDYMTKIKATRADQE